MYLSTSSGTEIKNKGGYWHKYTFYVFYNNNIRDKLTRIVVDGGIKGSLYI